MIVLSMCSRVLYGLSWAILFGMFVLDVPSWPVPPLCDRDRYVSRFYYLAAYWIIRGH